MKTFILSLLLLATLIGCKVYPSYSQCDTKWSNQKYASSSNTICQVGDIITSVAMAMSGEGHTQNPSTLNQWLKSNKGYGNKNQYIWTAINSFGMTYEGTVPNSLIKLNLDVGYVVIIQVSKGPHYVLATGYNGNTITVNDPLYPSVKSYDLSTVVAGHTNIYKVPVTLPPAFQISMDEIRRMANRKIMEQILQE